MSLYLKYLKPCLLLSLILTLQIASGQALQAQENWPRFRGENGEGASEADSIPISWTEDDFNWRVKLPGSGNSSPVVWGDKLFLQCADPNTAKRFLVCIDAESGESNWVKEFESTPHRLHSRNTFASCTPAVDAEHVYFAWSTPTETLLKAFDHEGNEVWSRDFGPWVSQHGFGTSPIVYKDMVILSNSQLGAKTKLKPDEKPGVSSMIALDRKTGKEVWTTSRGSEVASYSVPYIFEDETGQDQLICCSTADGMYSLDPNTGKENWSIDAFTMRTIASPIAAGGYLFGSTGSGGGGNYVVAIRPGKKPEIAYKITRSAGYVPTPLAYKGMLFVWYDKGMVSCIDVASGETLWRERVEGEFSGSPIRVKDNMYCISDEGKVFVIAADREFKQLAVNPLGEHSRSTPAVANGKMYLRTENHLMSIGG